MDVSLKRFDLLIREVSSVTQEEILSYLENVFKTIEENNNESYKRFGYSAVFDARTSEYYLYYSDGARDFFKMSRNRYDLIPQGLITKSNFISFIKQNITEIKKILFGRIKIVTDKLKVNKKGEAKLNYEPSGDIIFNTAEVQKSTGSELYEVNMKDKDTITGLPAKDDEYQAIVSYLTM